MFGFTWGEIFLGIGAMALIVAIIGGPILYHNKRVDEEYAKGFRQGHSECMTKWNQFEAEKAENEKKTIRTESNQAVRNISEEKRLRDKISKLEEQLRQKADEKPDIRGILFDPELVRVWKSALRGDFGGDGDSVSSNSNDKVS